MSTPDICNRDVMLYNLIERLNVAAQFGIPLIPSEVRQLVKTAKKVARNDEHFKGLKEKIRETYRRA